MDVPTQPAQQAGDASSGAEMQAPKQPAGEEVSRTAEDKLMDVVDKILDPGLPFPKYADTVGLPSRLQRA